VCDLSFLLWWGSFFTEGVILIEGGFICCKCWWPFLPYDDCNKIGTDTASFVSLQQTRIVNFFVFSKHIPYLLDCKPHLNIGYLTLWDTFAYWHVSRLFVTLVMMLHHYNCFLFIIMPLWRMSTWCWREYYVKRGFGRKTRSQGKAEHHLYFRSILSSSILYRNKNISRPWLQAARNDFKINYHKPRLTIK